nr:hypothetical protein [Candidatus Ornithobacterium hominis]
MNYLNERHPTFLRFVKVLYQTAIDFYTKLIELNAQFRKIGVNYNQIVKILYRHNILHAHQKMKFQNKP